MVAAYPRYVETILEPSAEIIRPANLTQLEAWSLRDANGEEGEVNTAALAQLAFHPGWLLTAGREDVVARWHATMHIDLLEGFQGQGWGKKLIGIFVESVKREGGFGEGIHIGIAGENSKVVWFYEKLGFELLERAGEGAGTIWMTRKIE